MKIKEWKPKMITKIKEWKPNLIKINFNIKNYKQIINYKNQIH